MYWLRTCIFSVQPQYKIGICKTCKKIIDFNYLKSADPRDGYYNWKGPQELIDKNCIKDNSKYILFDNFLKKNK